MAAATKDAVLASAVDLARAAAEEVAEDAALVGEHLGPVVEGERLVSHRFAATAPGYRGWYWSVTVARVPRGRKPTICEVDLLPGQDAVLAPTWVPWAERLRPGDVGPGDVLPYLEDDDRLEPGYTATGEADADELAIFELGLGRERVLSREGRAEAAERWYTGSRGPTAAQAVAASAPCSTCAFLVLMAGSLRTEFGVCANEWAPDDGRVVSMDHGCGAHSQTDVTPPPSDWPDQSPVIDEHDVEIVRVQGEDDDQGDEADQAAPASSAESSTSTEPATEATPEPAAEAGSEPEAPADREPETPAEPDPAPTADEE
ncbi:DUF3027 domain-containing protein [Actinotalea sp. BY-33]|uniref:DUF3027 domain-containing protein n=1 Tax=Actinotalea soli TaxID=2819234 RepID=A0A939LQL9_9CELL|nr:DUF3027 domain-containing protein [Actinotalea soli]MBO1752203.1 DUF3027 domain-containing protein [Actinotalea soli]